ncbi:NAC domain-containing protein 72 [Linum grandiflorum]
MNSDQRISIENYLASLSMSSGLRFCPTEKELVCQFLVRKLRGSSGSSDHNDPIVEADLYAVEPWILWEAYSSQQDDIADVDDEGEVLYFYTIPKRKKLSNGERKSSRFDRGVADGKGGTWHQEAVSKIPVQHHLTGKKNRQGTMKSVMEFEKKRFSYQNPNNPEQDGRWIMHEYSRSGQGRSIDNNWTICRLHQNPKFRAKSSLMVLASSPVSILDYEHHGVGGDDDHDPKRSKVIASC